MASMKKGHDTPAEPVAPVVPDEAVSLSAALSELRGIDSILKKFALLGRVIDTAAQAQSLRIEEEGRRDAAKQDLEKYKHLGQVLETVDQAKAARIEEENRLTAVRRDLEAARGERNRLDEQIEQQTRQYQSERDRISADLAAVKERADQEWRVAAAQVVQAQAQAEASAREADQARQKIAKDSAAAQEAARRAHQALVDSLNKDIEALRQQRASVEKDLDQIRAALAGVVKA